MQIIFAISLLAVLWLDDLISVGAGNASFEKHETKLAVANGVAVRKNCIKCNAMVLRWKCSD